WHVNKWSPLFLRYLFGMGLNFIRYSLRELSKILVQDSHAREETIHPSQMAYGRDVPSKQNPVKTCYIADDAAFVPLHKALHGFLRLVFVCCKTNHARKVMERHPFGCGPRAALCLCVEAFTLA